MYSTSSVLVVYESYIYKGHEYPLQLQKCSSYCLRQRLTTLYVVVTFREIHSVGL